MSVEVFLFVEARTVALDLETNNLQCLRNEFNEWCDDDEAMKERRKKFAPVFSMFNKTLNTDSEIKRKYAFRDGDKINVTWSPLQFEVITYEKRLREYHA